MMQAERAREVDPGLVVRIPKALIGPLMELSRDSHIPPPTLVRILLEQSISDPPKWMRERTREIASEFDAPLIPA